MDVDVEGPVGGLHIYMLWMLLFVRGFPMERLYPGYVGFLERQFIIGWMSFLIMHQT